MLKRCLVLLLLVTGQLMVSGSAQATGSVRPVVVVGVPGLRWDQVSAQRTPELWGLAHTGSAGVLSIRSAADITCAADGWLTVGAGNRVRARTATCGDYPSDFAAIARDNKRLDFGAVPGILATSLAPTGCVSAIGPGAPLGAADRSGRVAVATSRLSTETLARCPVTLVGAPIVRTAADAEAADSLVRAVDHGRPAGSVLLVVGLSDTDRADRAHLHVAIATGGPYGPGELVSQSTRRAPYVQLIDVAATVLELRGVPRAGAIDGQPWRTSGDRPARLRALVNDDKAAGAAGSTLPWGAALLVALAVVGTALALTARRRVAAAVLLVALAGPVATYLVNLTPWSLTGAPTVVTLLGTLVVAGLIAVPAFLVGERRSWVLAVGGVTGFTFAVLVADLVTGARLQLDSVLGYSPLVAGRFAGVGNVAYGVLGASALLLATAVAITRPGLRWAAAIAVVAVVVDGAPFWGSDVGGVLALVPAFAVLLLLCSGRQVSWARIVAIAAAAVGIVLVFALADYARPAAHQTHLGRFIGKILHGGAGTVLDRKWHSDLDLLTANPATLFVPVAAAVGLWLVLRPRPRLARAYETWPELRFGLIAVAVLSVVGLLVNDSGIAIPAVAVLVTVPYVLVMLTGDTTAEPRTEGQHVLP